MPPRAAALLLLVACLALGTSGRQLAQLAQPLASAAPGAAPPNGAALLSPVADSTSSPFSWVGQLANGCTAFLVGPCHALTVAHCVYDPHREIWWPGVELFPGRNVQANGTGWSPLGSSRKRDVALAPGWRREPKGRPEHDVALVLLESSVGDRLGHFRLPGGESAASGACRLKSETALDGGETHSGGGATNDADRASVRGGGGGGSSGGAGRSSAADGGTATAGVAALGGALCDGPSLSVVGYPDNKRNGSMWEQRGCRPVRWGFESGMLWHACATRGGNSGSPLFVQPGALPGELAAACGSSGGGGGHQGGDAASAGCLVAVAMHVASLRLLRGSILGRGLEAELRAGGLPVELAEQAAVEEEAEALVVPLAVPLAGETLAWLKASIEKMACPHE